MKTKQQNLARHIREALNDVRDSMNLSFEEEGHIYTFNGRTDIDSVSGIVARYCTPFDSEKISLRKAGGDIDIQQQILDEWANIGDRAAQMGSRVHYELEKESLRMWNIEKEVRKPSFELTQHETETTDNKLEAGKRWLLAMQERNCHLIDTEVVVGQDSPYCSAVGQLDTLWLVDGLNEAGHPQLVLTDYKTSKAGKFDPSPFDKLMLPPFDFTEDGAHQKYQLQITLYERLLLHMLHGSKFDRAQIKGSAIIHLLDDCNYVEYGVSDKIRDVAYNVDIIDHQN